MREEEAAAGERFGTRYLTDADKVFDHNAWDNVPWDESMEEDALKVVEKQKSAKVEEERAAELVGDPAKQWDAFYSIHTNKFFMDRNWLLKEFPEFDMTQRPENKKLLLKLACETLKYRTVFDELLKERELYEMVTDPMIEHNFELVYVLLYEFLGGNGLNRASPKLKAVVYSRAKAIQDAEKFLAEEGRGMQSIKDADAVKSKPIEVPRYARINTLKWTTEQAIKTLEEEEWKITHLSPTDDFASRVSSIGEADVFVDPHVENLLIFKNNNEFHTYWMVEQRYLILQDKASCLPAFLLEPTAGSHVFDCCAAPGMKTSHVAALLNNEGKVWAMDRAADRVDTMNQLLEYSGVTNASVFNGDFLKTDTNDKKFSKVKFAIVDPPCSGSGIVKRMDELVGGNADERRLAKLKNLQAMILKHALKLPRLQRVVYSTCSVHAEENEQVVEEVLNDDQISSAWQIKKGVLPSWTERGLKEYECGEHCLRADPRTTLTNGFFVAVIERK